jgi:uncharacterized lipoprotein YehR (DUF1307 family)
MDSKETTDMYDLSLSEVEHLLSITYLKKDILKQIASERFGIPLGSIGSRKNVIKQIKICIDNERALDIIADIASLPRQN